MDGIHGGVQLPIGSERAQVLLGLGDGAGGQLLPDPHALVVEVQGVVLEHQVLLDAVKLLLIGVPDVAVGREEQKQMSF